MIKLRNEFVSVNNVRVILKLERNKNKTYDIYAIVVGGTDETTRTEYITEVGKVGCQWCVTDANLDNFEKDYLDVKFNKLTELIDYIGVTEIENKEWFNIY